MSAIRKPIEPGVDVTRRVGVFSDPHLQFLKDRYQGAFALAVDQPKVEHFRLCVDAYDEFLAEFRERHDV